MVKKKLAERSDGKKAKTLRERNIMYEKAWRKTVRALKKAKTLRERAEEYAGRSGRNLGTLGEWTRQSEIAAYAAGYRAAKRDARGRNW